MYIVGTRFKYEPDALREAVLHPRPLLPTAAPLSPRARKRQRVDNDDREDAMRTTADAANTNAPVRRGVELDTAAERFLLRMYEADSDDNGTNAGNEDAGSDKIKTPAEDQQHPGGEVTHAHGDRRRWEIWLLGALDDASSRDRPPPPPSSTLDGKDGAIKEGTVVGGAVLLQRGLLAENLEFVEGEVRVLQDTPAVDSGSCAREGWAIEVRRWRWSQSC